MRAAHSLTITLSMVAIPVKLYLAASDDTLSFNMLTKAGNRVKQKLFDAVTDEEVQAKDCDKGYEFIKGQYVRFTTDELKALELKTSKDVAIREFIEPELIDFAAVEKTYYVGPDKGGDKAYALLADTLRTTRRVAIAQWTDKGKQKLVAIRPYANGLAFQILYYTNEVRDFNEIEIKPYVLTKEEKALARQLVDAHSNIEAFDPYQYTDGYQIAVKNAVEQKVQNRDVQIMAETTVTATSLDLIAALKNSLEVPKEAPKAKRKGGKK